MNQTTTQIFSTIHKNYYQYVCVCLYTITISLLRPPKSPLPIIPTNHWRTEGEGGHGPSPPPFQFLCTPLPQTFNLHPPCPLTIPHSTSNSLLRLYYPSSPNPPPSEPPLTPSEPWPFQLYLSLDNERTRGIQAYLTVVDWLRAGWSITRVRRNSWKRKMVNNQSWHRLKAHMF